MMMLKYIYIYVLKESQLYNNFSTSKYLFTLSFLSDPSNSPLNLISSKGSSNLHGVKDYPMSFTLKITTSQNRINSCHAGFTIISQMHRLYMYRVQNVCSLPYKEYGILWNHQILWANFRGLLKFFRFVGTEFRVLSYTHKKKYDFITRIY